MTNPPNSHRLDLMGKAPSINLLKKNQKSTIDKILDWALTIGRFVVILTEAIALSAFLYRFTLDRQLIDLHDQIEQKQTIIQLLKPNEDRYRNLQSRLQQAQTLGPQAEESVNIFENVTTIAPVGFTINKLTVTSRDIRIEASAQSVNALAEFVENLRAFDFINTVSLDKVQNKTSTAIITVGITASLKNL